MAIDSTLGVSDDRVISFVATSRNDDHGGDALRRTQSFVNGLALQCERHRLRGELVLVDWNPPASRLPLAEVLSWPAGSEWFTAKVVTVPQEVHLRLPNARSLTMFQMIAKNVGIRRASGDIVVATNIDILFSDELMNWMKTTDFEDRAVYRSDRWDIPNDIQLEPDFDVLLARAKAEAIRYNRLDGTVDIVDGELVEPPLKRVDHLLLGPIQNSLEQIRHALETGEDVRPRIDHLLRDTLPAMRRFYLTPRVHLNGCGDFTLMSAASWDDLRGYPEWAVFSWNIDSVTLVHAVCSGYKHIEAPSDAVHFHIEHSYGSGYTPQGWDSLWQRMRQRDITVITWEDYRSLVLDMEEDFRAKRRIDLNEANWGMASLDLPIQATALPGSTTSVPLQPTGEKLVELFDSTGLARRPLLVLDADTSSCEAMDLRWAEGSVAARIRLPSSSYGYGAIWETTKAWPRNQYVWLRCFCRVDTGRVSLVLLSEDGKTFVHEAPDLIAGGGRRELITLVPPLSFDPKIVLRNHGAAHSEVEISDIDIFWQLGSDSADVDWMDGFVSSPWVRGRATPPAICRAAPRPDLQQDGVMVLGGSASSTSVHDHHDLVKRELYLPLRLKSVGPLTRDKATGSLSLLPPPQPWALAAERMLDRSELFDGPQWLVLEFDRLSGSYGVGLRGHDGGWIDRIEVPQTDRPVEVWLSIPSPADVGGFAVENWMGVSTEPALLRRAWTVRAADGFDELALGVSSEVHDGRGWIDVTSAMHRKDWTLKSGNGFLIPGNAPADHAVYGPYAFVEPGPHQVSLSLSADAAQDDRLAIVEVALTSGTMLVEREVFGRDVSNGPLVLNFEVPPADELEQFEMRVSQIGRVDIQFESAQFRAVPDGSSSRHAGV